MDIALIKLEKEFLNTSFVQYQDDFEGQKVLNDGTIVIGNKAGPSSYNTISNTCHEMSHLVEIDDARMRCYGWGLKYPEVWVYDRTCIEPTTHQITDRELRVMAYQINLLEYIGVKYSVEDTVSVCQYLPDTAFVPIEDNRQPYGDNYEAVEAEGIDIDASQQRWRVNQVNRLRNEFTIDRFISEWNRKIEWMNYNEYVPLTFE
jgi:hypothetical protein